MEKKKNAFTLIELVAVLVILAILALIVTPLVMNIVKKAKDSANKRSVDVYGKAVELAVATYLLDNGDYPTTLDDLAVEYTGNEVVCNVKILNENGSIYLSECSVKGTEVKDSSTEDGWYHYGKTTTTAPIVYQAYNVGDTVSYNGMNFYVIENSDENSDRVTLLKAEPLTVDEVNTYGVDHVNRYTYKSVGTSYNINNTGYGGMAYYTSENCGYINGSVTFDGCTTNYDLSDIKHVVDAWAADKLNENDYVEAKLITKEEYENNCNIEQDVTPSGTYEYYVPKYEWLYHNDYVYWGIDAENDSSHVVLAVARDGRMYGYDVDSTAIAIRPVVTILKSAI